ncbi:phage major tail tube protein [Billgrantia montanilacus]|uniref:Phage major tail tube protein n=1 Tax=Billgrantia montanilacus TaxID=2282305 RepID=A0A368TY56_9GAMM|nr:phage major tail tube protein [Halomonas montanilacus]RCV89715.1 phage major tail tube protein [Halomonas montanilacus]
MLPKILKDFNLFGDGNNWQGMIPELTLPEMARRMVEYEGGGMDGPIEVDQGGALQEFEWTAGGMIVEIFDTFGSPIHDAALLRMTGSYESDETGEVVPVEIVMRGRHKTIALGDASKGDNNQISVTTTLSYFKLSVDGQEIIERDVPGFVFRVRGEDRYAQRRQALGL